MLTEDDLKRVDERAELQVRRYFDDYLLNVFPTQVEQFINLHDRSDRAHGGVENRVNRAVWWLTGAAAVGGTGLGTFLPKFIAVLTG